MLNSCTKCNAGYSWVTVQKPTDNTVMLEDKTECIRLKHDTNQSEPNCLFAQPLNDSSNMAYCLK